MSDTSSPAPTPARRQVPLWATLSLALATGVSGALIALGVSGDDDSEVASSTDVQAEPSASSAVTTAVVETVSPTSAASTPVATTVTPSTAEATTTTERPTTTTRPEPIAYGLVWQSVVDESRVNTRKPRPTFKGAGIAVRIDAIALVTPTGESPNAAECASSIEAFQVSGDTCIVVQYRYDVAADFPVDDNSPQGQLIAGSAITPDGLQLDTGLVDVAFPGTRDNVFVVIYAGGVPGSRVLFQTGSNLAQYIDHELTVPPLDELKRTTPTETHGRISNVRSSTVSPMAAEHVHCWQLDRPTWKAPRDGLGGGSGRPLVHIKCSCGAARIEEIVEVTVGRDECEVKFVDRPGYLGTVRVVAEPNPQVP